MRECDIVNVAQKYGTPLYYYDSEVMQYQMEKLKNAILPGARLFYALKANPLIGICQFFNSNGCGIETASSGEIETALRASVCPEDIIFTSPGKTIKEIEYAIDSEIKLINVESLAEIEIINDISAKKDKITDIALRINQNLNFANAKIKMTGVASQFGIDEDDLVDSLFESIENMANVRLIGVQVYSGTQVLVADEILKNVEYVVELALHLSKKHCFPLKYLNLGGGFGVPYFKGDSELDLGILKEGMGTIYEKYHEQLKETEVIFESGRYLMAESGVYIVKVLYRKQSKQSTYYICDGGSNFHSATAFIGRFVRNNFPCYSIPRRGEATKVNIVGPLCTPTDVMGQNVELSGDLVSGDYIVIDKSGAYGLSYSPTLFLSHESPMEVLRINNDEIVLRDRGKANDMWINQKGIKSVYI